MSTGLEPGLSSEDLKAALCKTTINGNVTGVVTGREHG